MIDLEILSKVFYAATILFSLRLFYLAWQGRSRDKFIRTIFIIYVVLIPLYAAFASMYILNIAYHSWVGYIGWTTINTLFLATDGMLLEYIIRHTKGLDNRGLKNEMA